MFHHKGFLFSVLGCVLALLLGCLGGQRVQAAGKHPAVLFTTDLHREYFLLPMHAEGIELHTCALADLPAELKTGKYNVVYVTGGFDQPAIVAALKDFMAAGGGVLVSYAHTWMHETDWQKRQDFLDSYGAHFVWVDLKENDPARVTASSYHMTLFQTDRIAAPFNQGVASVLYFPLMHVQGASPAPLVTDENWTAIVRGSPTSVAVPYTDEKQDLMRRYVPQEAIPSPILLAGRQVGTGRLAAFALAPEWVMNSPTNCPPVQEMLTTGVDKFPSNWVRVLANTFRWLAEPTLAAGKGGEPTPPALLAPPIKQATKPAVLRDWTKAPPLEDQEQLPGLVGAQSSYSGGQGTVAEWAAAAKAAGLKFLVFLDPLDRISREDYAKLQHDCAAATDDTFFACPGLRYQDVWTKTNCFAYGEEVQYPRADLLTADGKYLNNANKPGFRSRHLFDYVLEQNNYHGEFGYFRHAANSTPPWEYRLYSLFTLYSTENGQPVDNDYADYDALQGLELDLTPLSISLMNKPADLAGAVQRDWLVISTAPGEYSDGTFELNLGSGVPAVRNLFKQLIAWLRPFQYITQGPRLLCWSPRWNVAGWDGPRGDWFRPDYDHYRVRLHVTSEVGLKEIKIMSMGQVLMRFLPNGVKDFDRTLEFENTQQRTLYPVVEDVQGKRAIGMVARNFNSLWGEFICGDRCNFLTWGLGLGPDGLFQFTAGGGNSVTQNKGTWAHNEIDPAGHLTSNAATLPTDGAPVGGPTTSINVAPQVDSEGFPQPIMMNCRPHAVLASPDVFIGGGTLNFVKTDPTAGEDAWSFFGAVKPNDWLEGGGLHTVFQPQVEGLRVGWYDLQTKARKDMPLGTAKLAVVFTWMPFTELRDGAGKVYAAGSKDLPPVGSFGKGAYVLQPEAGGVTALVSLDDNLRYEVVGGNNVRLGLQVDSGKIPQGMELNMRLGYIGGAEGRTLADLRHYLALMSAPLPGVQLTGGKLALMDGIAMHVDAGKAAVEMKIAPLDLQGRLQLVLENEQPNWDVWLLDRARKQPNWRQIPKVGATAYASLPSEVRQDLFIGPPVLADRDEVHLSLCNLLPGQWLVTLHNPTDNEIKANVWSAPGWSAFTLAKKQYAVPAGSSVDIPVTAR
jgi:hypothetical protein